MDYLSSIYLDPNDKERIPPKKNKSKLAWRERKSRKYSESLNQAHQQKGLNQKSQQNL